MVKRSKHPITSAMGELETRAKFKGKSPNKFHGWWRPKVGMSQKPLTYAPVRPIGR